MLYRNEAPYLANPLSEETLDNLARSIHDGYFHLESLARLTPESKLKGLRRLIRYHERQLREALKVLDVNLQEVNVEPKASRWSLRGER